MDTFLDYLKWRGDISFLQSDFNEVDNLIFSAFTYLDFPVLEKDKFYKLSELCDKINNFQFSKQEKFINLLKRSERFSNIIVTKYVNKIEEKEEKQFGAMTFILPNNTLFVAFKGTLDNLVGWKEDFNLGYMNVIPSQIEAKEYLDDILIHTNKNVIVGGHSKGGNLAMYAAIFCDDELKSKIFKVFNNDGPGLSDSLITSNSYQKIKDKIITFIPKKSLIGYLFENTSQVELVDSYQIGILQHDLYSWKINKNTISRLQTLDNEFNDIKKKVNKILSSIPIEKRKYIIDMVYQIVSNTPFEKIEDIFKEKINDNSYLSKYKLDEKDINLFMEIFQIILFLIKKIELI